MGLYDIFPRYCSYALLVLLQKCLSAKNAGMRFPGWKEPKPLRSRCGSAVVDETRGGPVPRSARKSRESKEDNDDSRSVRRSRVDETEVNEIINRLSQPTMSSKTKSSTGRAREAGTDMNWYSWSKMNVYKDYQGVLYGKNGALKRPVRNKDR